MGCAAGLVLGGAFRRELSVPGASASSICGECGYDLAGLSTPGGFGTCPECGAKFLGAHPFAREPWPPWWRLAMFMCGPTVLLMAVIYALAHVWVGMMFLLMAMPLVLALWVLVAVAVPLWVAGSTVRRCVLRPGWNRLTLLLAGLAGAVNIAVTVLALAALIRS